MTHARTVLGLMLALLVLHIATAAATCGEEVIQCLARQCGKEYKGCQNVTVSGEPCQPWNPQDGRQHLDGNKYTDYELIGHNYCRNPDSEHTIWCYTNTGFDYCEPLVTCADSQRCTTNATTHQCREPVCVNGTCGTAAKADQTPCRRDDADEAECKAGECMATVLMCDPAECAAGIDDCHLPGSCHGGRCTEPLAPNGTPCNGGGVCSQGVCVLTIDCGGVNCTVRDWCHVPVCVNGTCSRATGADGMACNDGNTATRNDTCLYGDCKGLCRGWDDALECGGRLREGDGDCDNDFECAPGLRCGHANCKRMHNSSGWTDDGPHRWDLLDDCCEPHYAQDCGSCENKCGEVAPHNNSCGCRCDPGCQIIGNCCNDYEQHCQELRFDCPCDSCNSTAVPGCGCQCSPSCMYVAGKGYLAAGRDSICCDDYFKTCAPSPCSCQGRCGEQGCDQRCVDCEASGDCGGCCTDAHSCRDIPCTCRGTSCYGTAVAECGRCACHPGCGEGDALPCCDDFGDICKARHEDERQHCTCRERCGCDARCGSCSCDPECTQDCCHDYVEHCEADIQESSCEEVANEGSNGVSTFTVVASVMVVIVCMVIGFLAHDTGFGAGHGWLPLGGQRKTKKPGRASKARATAA